METIYQQRKTAFPWLASAYADFHALEAERDAHHDYERFIGWTYESLGYAVEYTGAIEGFRNMGRDLICRRGSDFRVVQCKYWRQEKEIHEKHIFQLFGSAMEYAFKSGHPLESVKPVLHTSTKLSDVAKKAAEVLHVEFHESVALGDYPLIKCNIRNKQKIYHLPFDQLYDRAHITQAGEQYCYTVKEAEELGFRRAWKWRGQQDAACDWPVHDKSSLRTSPSCRGAIEQAAVRERAASCKRRSSY